MNKSTIPIKAKVFVNGNSRAVRIPSYIQPHIVAGDLVEVIITKTKQPREGWSQQFAKVVTKNHDTTVIDEFGALHDNAAIADGLENLDENWDQIS